MKRISYLSLRVKVAGINNRKIIDRQKNDTTELKICAAVPLQVRRNVRAH